ncbi:translation initiation factor 3 subunit 10, putative [Babesia bigemina]|uniref:Eukaryotic translation initiation factor 3 subunit A n=1 Tax=Babesia bigemina TaxID=5866 RepID=A0A061D787_BABBI|nr:translation initiation factor 3 subunit 10, putative [Babesia bigemina]CDR95827.1 translation initiation factor 3 subunit 10, putative [Babesia bigemina]|eukprot:XP_012768013.1 translation initiation factor 3 subunit 10, putative [Babesia bigemina]
MHNFQKPENALKRAAELRAIGQNDEALQILHSAIGHRSFRIQGWDMVQEQIMLEYVALCIAQDKLRMARDGLHQYRLVAQHANVTSLGKVVVELLDHAEERLRRIKADIAADKSKAEDLEKAKLSAGLDAEYSESPEEIMVFTLQLEVRDATARSLHSVFRFLWETYKMILDIMRATPKLEKVYHDTARKAIQFCRENERLSEFKRLCEVLRAHNTFLMRVKHKPEMECMLKPELHIETRINQLVAACDMSLWKEAFNTVEDLYTLGIRDYITKTFQGSVSVLGQQKEKLLKWLAIFYEKLAIIFSVSDLHLFHALAVLRYVMHIRMYKKKVAPEDVQYMCSKAVLAVLAVPDTNKNGADSGELITPMPTSAYEMHKRMAALLGYNSIPTRESLHYALVVKNILPMADDNTKKLYELMQGQSNTSLQLCKQVLPLLTETAEPECATAPAPPCATYIKAERQVPNTVKIKFFDKLSNYYPKVKAVVFRKVLNNISKVYANMTIDFFVNSICPREFYPWNDAEKYIVDLVQRGFCHIRLDYSSKVLYFNASKGTADSIAAVRHQLTNLGRNLYYAMRVLDPEQSKQAEDRHLQLVAMKNNIEKERTKLMKRTSEIYQRRQEHQEELMRVEEERKKMEMEQKLQEERAEKERREEALRQMEKQRKKDEKMKMKLETAQQMLKAIRKLGGSQGTKIIIKGKTLDEINVEDVMDGFVNFDDVEKAQEELKLRERQEIAKQRRAEVKRIDHLVRALREHQQQLYADWQKRVLEDDTRQLMEVQKKREAMWKEDAEALQLQKNALKEVAAVKEKWVNDNVTSMKAAYDAAIAEQRSRFLKKMVADKIQRARERRVSELRRQKELEEERRLEEERMRQEEEERKKQEAEAEKQRKLQEIAEKQRQKELEIQRRLDEQAARATHSAAAPDLRRSETWTKSQPRDEPDLWRSDSRRVDASPQRNSGSTVDKDRKFRPFSQRSREPAARRADDADTWRR